MSLEDQLYPLRALYESMPESARRAVGFGWRCLPERLRLGRAYVGFRDLIEESLRWSPERTAEYQREQLYETIRRARRDCPFYRTRLQGDELAELPFITKADLQVHRDAMLSERFGAGSRLYITTGGSTGVPVGFHLQKGVSRPKEQAFLEAQWRRAGYEPGMRLAVIRGQVTDEKADGRIAYLDATRNWLMLSSYHLTAGRLPEYLDAIERFRPDLLHIYPSAALQLAEFLEQQKQTWRTPIRGMLCGSERLNPPQKRLLERVFDCRVYRWYGHSERVILAGEGRESDLFYFWPTYGHVEFGDADAEGFREVIGTSFHNHVMPLIRYRTGDYVKLAEGEAREFPWPAVSEVAGREQEFLIGPGGRRISLTAFNMHDAVFDDLYAVQFFQEEAGVAELRYVAGPDFHGSRLEKIRRVVSRKLGDDFVFEMKAVAETEKTARGKHKWLVSRINY
jgi:phenylacetate-CoA ligase